MADARLDAIARGCRVQIIRMLTHAGSGHPGGSLSVIDLLVAIAFGRLRHDPRRPDWPERDRIVLSKGHAVPALYCVMAKAGYFSEDALITLRKLGSPLHGHDMAQIGKALDQAEASKGTPTLVVAHTVKGKGVSFMENNPEWHGKAPKPAEAVAAIREILGVTEAAWDGYLETDKATAAIVSELRALDKK